MMTKWDINLIVEEYADTITRICYSYGKNYDDTQDIMQNVFLKLMRAEPEFDTKEHEKAWIIRVTINECKDFLKSIFHRHTSLEEVQEIHQGGCPEAPGQIQICYLPFLLRRLYSSGNSGNPA